MVGFFRRHSIAITAFMLFLVSLQLMSLSVANRALPRSGGRWLANISAPAEKGYHELAQLLQYFWQHYFYLIHIEEERDDLVARIKELESRNSRLTEYESENRRLKNLLRFSERSSLNGIVASVIARDSSNWISTITIDRGSDDGLREGLAVVDGNAIVGQTTAVGKKASKVLLLTDNTSAIDAIVQTSRAEGTIEGGANGAMLQLRYVLKLKEFAVSPGDRVIASGLDGVYPKGTLIGIVHTVDVTGGGLFQEIDVQPSVDIFRLENVLVLISENPPIDFSLPVEESVSSSSKNEKGASNEGGN